MKQLKVKLKAGQVRIPVTLIFDGEGLIYLKFQFNRSMITELKNMEGARWRPEKRVWSIADSQRNHFQLRDLMGEKPYEKYDRELIHYDYERPLRNHQKVFSDWMLTTRQLLLAGEMGCVAGDSIVHVNRAGKGFEIPLKKLHYCLSGGTTRGRLWDLNIPTYIRSLKGETLGLHRVVKTLYKDIKETVLVLLKSGKSIRLTPDHEIYTGLTTHCSAGSLIPGDIVLSNGQWVDKDGYVRVGGLKDSHPRWTTGGVYQHILIMEEKLGRYLDLNECIHHKNGIRHDNRIENLEIMSASEHGKLHGRAGGFCNMHNGGKVQFIPQYDTVVSVEPSGKCDVYDIVCDEPYRNFVADGIIVHNCGKTLSAIEVMERSDTMDWFYVAPKSALKAVHLEFKKWEMLWRPRTMTYEGMTKLIQNWEPGKKPPFGVIFDESARLKNYTSQRSQAAKHLADSIREEYGDDGFVILMSGAPAPKSPTDWYHQCEIACPGFLKEGNVAKFKKRLAIIVDRESVQGGVYPHIVSWLDDEKKCSNCGEYTENENHHPTLVGEEFHPFKPSKNEVSYLYKRMQGLVHVKFKKDCLELPEIQYRVIRCEVSQKTLNLAQGIVDRARNTISAITKLRTLSDGFMYREEEIGEEICPKCSGVESQRPIINDQPYCDVCDNAGKVKKTARQTYQIETPKEEVVVDLLDEHIDVGRLIFYAGFTGAIERLVEICKKSGWDYIKADGKGWKQSFEGDCLEAFQNGHPDDLRIAFIGNPGAAGTGLTLTASPTTVYYSNDFDADHRIQSKHRFHRMGMDLNRGCTVVDIIHLPTDELVLDNLIAKQNLQSLTLGQVREALV